MKRQIAKRLLVGLLLSVLPLFLIGCATVEVVKKPEKKLFNGQKIAVLTFSSNFKSVGPKISRAVYNEMRSRGIDVLFGKELEAMLAASGIDPKAAYDLRLLVKKDLRIGAAIVGHASVMRRGGLMNQIIECESRMVDLKDGTVIAEVRLLPPRRSSLQSSKSEEFIGRALGKKYAGFF